MVNLPGVLDSVSHNLLQISQIYASNASMPTDNQLNRDLFNPPIIFFYQKNSEIRLS